MLFKGTIITFISICLISCAKNKSSDGKSKNENPELKAASIMPGCYTQLIVRQYKFIPEINGDFPEPVSFDLNASKNLLAQKLYNYLGETAADHSDNVVVIINLAKDLSQAEVTFRQWTQDPDSPIFEIDGNVEIKAMNNISVKASSVDEAVGKVLSTIPACDQLQ